MMREQDGNGGKNLTDQRGHPGLGRLAFVVLGGMTARKRERV